MTDEGMVGTSICFQRRNIGMPLILLQHLFSSRLQSLEKMREFERSRNAKAYT
jgi:hypothetical protein